MSSESQTSPQSPHNEDCARVAPNNSEAPSAEVPPTNPEPQGTATRLTDNLSFPEAPKARRSSSYQSEVYSGLGSSSPVHKNSTRRGHHRKTHSTSVADQPMGHFPPRPEDQAPQQTQTTEQSAIQDSFIGISNQFEETVGKPSREALLKFFYPRSDRSLVSPNRHSSRGVKSRLSPQARENLQINSLDHEISDHPSEINAESGPQRNIEMVSTTDARLKTPEPFPIPGEQYITAPNNSEVYPQQSAAGQASPSHHPRENPNVEAPNHGPPTNPPSTSSFQQRFDAEEEEDRKYVERFWTTYDDIIMLSMFTQLGVVARLAVSTCFTYFDGIFRESSPLFTVLPMNCFSCFVLGLLGSGERLMEVITTRFSSKRLQQRISREDATANVMDEDDLDADEENANLHRKGLNRRRGKKQRIRNRPNYEDGCYRSGWEPPLHLHDDLREVQLLALERRIRASKCLVLFPVRKEDADVMEHYIGESYRTNKAFDYRKEQQKYTRDRRGKLRKRRRGRKKYQATDMSDMNDDQALGQNQVERGEHEDFYSDDEGDDEDSDDDYSGEALSNGLYNFDLKLTESIEVTDTSGLQTRADSTGSSPSSGSLPPSVEKLIMRSPGLSSQSGKLPPTSTTKQKLASTTPMRSIDSQSQTSGVSDQESVVSMVTATGGETEQDTQHLDQIFNNVQASVSENVALFRRANIADGWDVGTTPEAMSDDIMLGLHVGFCGALSSFSSWNSSMLDLIRGGHYGEALIGYLLGLQLPIVAYRFGQHVAVYYFVWRCRRETRRDERRGYGIRLNTEVDEDSFSGRQLRAVNSSDLSADDRFEDERSRDSTAGSLGEVDDEDDAFSQEVPSVRAICTALYLLALGM